jgi:hypothetical protein
MSDSKCDEVVARIKAEIGAIGESLVPREEWLRICSFDFTVLGDLARNEGWKYEFVGNGKMRFKPKAQ